jgi:hypothetical protein
LAQILQGIAAATLFIIVSRVAAAEDSARVFVYSQTETPARSWTTVFCDGKAIAEVKRGFFFALNLHEGRYALSLTDGVPISVEVSPATETFVRINWSHDVRGSPIPVLSRVEQERAKREMRFLSYIDTKRIHSTAVSRVDPRPAESPQLKTREP